MPRAWPHHHQLTDLDSTSGRGLGTHSSVMQFQKERGLHDAAHCYLTRNKWCGVKITYGSHHSEIRGSKEALNSHIEGGTHWYFSASGRHLQPLRSLDVINMTPYFIVPYISSNHELPSYLWVEGTVLIAAPVSPVLFSLLWVSARPYGPRLTEIRSPLHR